MQSSGSAAAVIADRRVLPQHGTGRTTPTLQEFRSIFQFFFFAPPGRELDPGLLDGWRSRGSNHPGMHDSQAGGERPDAAARVRRLGAGQPDAPGRERALDPRWPRGRVAGRGGHMSAIASLAAVAPGRFRPGDAALEAVRPIRYCGAFPGNNCGSVPCPARAWPASLRASVGSTEASDGRLARVGSDRRSGQRLVPMCPGVIRDRATSRAVLRTRARSPACSFDSVGLANPHRSCDPGTRGHPTLARRFPAPNAASRGGTSQAFGAPAGRPGSWRADTPRTAGARATQVSRPRNSRLRPGPGLRRSARRHRH
jgi:hypothetical protein